MPPPNLSAEDVERLVAVLKNLSTDELMSAN